MLKGFIVALMLWYNRRDTIIADPTIAKKYTINRRVYLDINSPEYDIAKDTLTHVAEKYGMAEFTDNGDNGAWAEYIEGCAIYRKKIAAYRKRQFKI